MRGIIAALNQEQGTVDLISEQGERYVTDFRPELAEAKSGMPVEFSLEGRTVHKLSLYRPENFESGDVPYTEVKDFAIYRTDELPFGQELIARAPFPVEREGRTEDSVKWKLMSFAKKCGANCLINYSSEQYIKNSIGFSYYMYRGHAEPAVAAVLDPKGVSIRAELEHKLDSEVLKHEYIIADGVQSGKLALKIVCGVLLVIFCLGFILAST